jgi:flagellar biosynthetic protein FliR
MSSLASPAWVGPWAVSILLLSIRVGMVFAMTPILGGIYMPPAVRVLIVIGLSAALSGALPSAAYRGAVAVGPLLSAALVELSIGAVMAAGVTLAFATFSVAGRILDIQIGFGMGQLLDPATNQNMPLLTGALTQLAMLCFFAVDGHHTVLRALAYSFEHFPMGMPWNFQNSYPVILKHLSGVFVLAFALIAPVVTCLMLVELGLGLIARNLPQMNMFVLGMPIKVIVGLSALAAWLGGAGEHVSRIFSSIFRSWEALFR